MVYRHFSVTVIASLSCPLFNVALITLFLTFLALGSIAIATRTLVEVTPGLEFSTGLTFLYRCLS